MKESMSIEELRTVSPEPINLEPSLNQKIPINESKSHYLRRSLRILSKVQRYSAYGFCGFLGIHVASVVITPGLGTSFPISQEIFEMSRSVYQGIPYFESLMVVGSTVVHIGAGVFMRIIRGRIRRNKGTLGPSKRIIEDKPVIKDDMRDDIGLGGVTGLLGLGYKKSWISTKFSTLSPLSFSGYTLIPLYAYHFFKFHVLPGMVDGDSSLINMDYITYYLNISRSGALGNLINGVSLTLLVWVTMYHSVSGMMKYLNKRNPTHKKIAYVVINSISFLGLISVARFKNKQMSDLNGFYGKSFQKYLNLSFI